MTTREQAVEAQGLAILHGWQWRKHLLDPVEIQYLFLACDTRAEMGLTLATLCDMVLGEDAADRSDAALIAGVRELLNTAKEYEDHLKELEFGDD